MTEHHHNCCNHISLYRSYPSLPPPHHPILCSFTNFLFHFMLASCISNNSNLVFHSYNNLPYIYILLSAYDGGVQMITDQCRVDNNEIRNNSWAVSMCHIIPSKVCVWDCVLGPSDSFMSIINNNNTELSMKEQK